MSLFSPPFCTGSCFLCLFVCLGQCQALFNGVGDPEADRGPDRRALRRMPDRRAMEEEQPRGMDEDA